MKKEKTFYPDYLIEITVVILIILEITIILALLFPPMIGRQINFSTPFQPLPEWYFYWLFQLVRYFPGKLTFVGAVVIPFLAAAVFICIPFIDKRKHGRIMTLFAAVILLTLFIVLTIIPALKY